jgi:hypothetical protein
LKIHFRMSGTFSVYVTEYFRAVILSLIKKLTQIKLKYNMILYFCPPKQIVIIPNCNYFKNVGALKKKEYFSGEFVD